jgi:hypothetical protein
MSDDGVEVRYRFLRDLPEPLREPTILNLHGDLRARGPAVVSLYDSLLNGRLPDRDALPWPDEPLRGALVDVLRVSGAPGACNADPELTTEIVLYLLGEVDVAQRFFERGVAALPHLLPEPVELDLSRDDVHGDTEALVRQLMCECFADRTRPELATRVGLGREVKSLVDGLAQALRLPPGTQRGLLELVDRRDVLRLRALLATIERVTRMVERLGRGIAVASPETVPEHLAPVVERTTIQQLAHLGPQGADLRGVERSAEIARMLPSEAVLLTHPVLRGLWHARRAERSLLAYHARGVWTERVPRTQGFEDGAVEPNPRAERGPVVVILDTSGSMRGFPEDLGKALVLRILATAHLEQRRCYVYNFSGFGDLLEHELGFDDAAIPALLRFLGLSFHGGTFPDEAIRRACERMRESAWRQADLVVISDGFFDGETSRGYVARMREVCRARVIGMCVVERPSALDMRLIMTPHACGSEDPAERKHARGMLAQLDQGWLDGFDGIGCDEVYELPSLLVESTAN